MSAAIGDGIMAFAGVVGSICGHKTNLLVGRDLVQKIRQYGGVPDMATCDLPLGRLLRNRLSAMNGSYLQRFLINTNMYLAPQTAFGATRCQAAHACMCERGLRACHSPSPFLPRP